MAEFKPNKEQQEFIDSSNCNVLVSASAGSGKTSTMIQKLLQILEKNKLPITSLMVVTYTNASASEMKQKLFNEISKLISNTDDLEMKSYFKKQIENINNAEIGTLHAICKKLIVKYFYEIGQSPDFSLLSERESKYLLDNAIQDVFTKHITSNDEDFYELYDCYNSKRNDLNLKQMCMQLFNYINTKIDYISWRNDFLNSSYSDDLNSNDACNYVFVYYKSILQEYSSWIKTLKLKANALGLEKYFAFLDFRFQFVDEFNKAKDFTTSSKVIFNLNLPNKPTKSKNADVDETDFDEEIDKFNKRFSDTIKRLKSDYVCDSLEDLKSNLNFAKKNLIKLFDIVEEIKENYSQVKKFKNVLDFNDLENLMLELLKNEQIKESLKSSYNCVFVDEYQDINDKQEEILLNLVSKDNYYMIGDVKQSIYAFRQSSPKIFISKFQSFSKDGVENRVINFNTNYRSDKNILEFNNYVFDTLITENTIGINYKENARFVSEKELAGCRVNLNIINIDNEESDKEKSEALVVANEIADLLTKTKSDGEKFTYKDIAIILRQRGTFVKTLFDTLTSLQIPVMTKINNDFFSTSEVNLLISILKVVSNFKNDIAIATVLKNLFEVSEKELLCIKNSNDSDFYNCVMTYSANDKIKAKIDKFFDFIEKSKIFLANHTIYEFLNNVVDGFEIILKFKSLPNGEEKESNILEFLILSDNDNYKYNIDKFLDYLDFVSKEKSLQIVGNGGNAVQICTIHYSKGLEYPAVILAGLGKKFQLNKDSSDIIINGRFGVGLKSIDSTKRIVTETIVRNACKLENKKSELDEEIRLLYVAMTRPKEYLTLIGQYNLEKYETNKFKSIYSSANFLEMIFKSFDNLYNSHFINKKEFVINEDLPSQAKINIINLSDIEFKKLSENNQVIIGNEDEKLLKTLLNVYNSKPNLETFTIKNTVTNILKEESDYENLNFMPNKLDATDVVENKDFLKIGTAYHSVMQELTFNENKEEIEILIDGLVQENIIALDIKNEIRVNEILKAKEVIGNLIKNADVVYKEKQFLLQESYNKLVKNTDNNTKVIVQGIIDLVVVRGENAVLIDYKTNRTSNKDLLKNQYRLQLEIYKLAFEKATNITINKTYLYSFYLGELIEID